MSKQTAVDWLFLMINNPNDNQEMALKCLEKAKQMEKKQIEEAYTDGQTISNGYQGASHYYNTEYGNDNK
jgi:hypothetical protein